VIKDIELFDKCTVLLEEVEHSEEDVWRFEFVVSKDILEKLDF